MSADQTPAATPLRIASMSSKRRRLAIARGTWRSYLVPIEPARAHAQRLHAHGMSVEGIAEVAGVPWASINTLIYPRVNDDPAKMLRRNADRVLAARVTHVGVSPHRKVPATGSSRRLRALMAIGWPNRHLAAELGVHEQQTSAIANRKKSVTAATATRIQELYDRLSMTPGPRPADKRWPPPLAWDDDTIDDPDAQPYGMGTSRPSGAAALELHQMGLTLPAIAQRLGIKEESARRAIERARAREEGAA